MRSSSLYRSAISLRRCSVVRSPRFEILSPTAITTWSKSLSAPSTSDSCPRVKGSKEPGKSAILFIIATKVYKNRDFPKKKTPISILLRYYLRYSKSTPEVSDVVLTAFVIARLLNCTVETKSTKWQFSTFQDGSSSMTKRWSARSPLPILPSG